MCPACQGAIRTPCAGTEGYVQANQGIMGLLAETAYSRALGWTATTVWVLTAQVPHPRNLQGPLPSAPSTLIPRFQVEVEPQPPQSWSLCLSNHLKLSGPLFFGDERLLGGLIKIIMMRGHVWQTTKFAVQAGLSEELSQTCFGRKSFKEQAPYFPVEWLHQ